MQVLIQASAVANDVAGLQAWCLDIAGPALLSRGSGISALTINLAVPTPAVVPYGNSEAQDGDAADIVMQIEAPEFGAILLAMLPIAAEFAARTRQQHAYQVTETQVKGSAGPRRIGASPGYKLIRGLHFFGDLPDVAVQRMWAHHSELAVRVHVGLARYARHWIDSVLTPGSPAIRGLSDLHFPDEDALRDQYFDSPRGRDEIVHDIGHFISGGTPRFYGKEFILQ